MTDTGNLLSREYVLRPIPTHEEIKLGGYLPVPGLPI